MADSVAKGKEAGRKKTKKMDKAIEKKVAIKSIEISKYK